MNCRYRTPDLTDIDQQGLHPDEACNPFGVSSSPGSVPITDDALERIGSKLALDSCVLTAENFLDHQLGISTVTGDSVKLNRPTLVGGEQVHNGKEQTSSGMLIQ